MPIITPQPFKNPFGYWNGHLQTILPSVFRKIPLPYEKRHRIFTPDNDFLDIDCTSQQHSNLVIVLHGLEGNSYRHYVCGLIKLFQQHGWDGVGYNCRSCSGELNWQPRLYHHADSEDFAFAIDFILQSTSYQNIALVGFSMGGNILIRYLAKFAEHLSPLIKVGVAISSPYHLKEVAIEIEKPLKRFYNDKFVKKMIKKVIQKKKILKEKFPIDEKDIFKIRTCRDFDKLITAPLHGFANPDEFYEQASISTHIHKVKIPILLLSASNDPLLTPSCFPYQTAQNSYNFYLEVTHSGGHVGFCVQNSVFTYAEQRALAFCQHFISSKL
ncbi:MAG: alpha/beta fold hydrolase [Cytophagales bacterium]|nr:alpha/beta fold hydrolase [Cytophagales bacterium]MDW8383566.1 alpha/beta fold hydrolase [Flammeovirgaceae bacterium]